MTAAKTAVATYELLVRSLSLSARRSALTFPAQKYQIMINTDYGAFACAGKDNKKMRIVCALRIYTSRCTFHLG